MGAARFPSRPFQLRDATSLSRQDIPNNRSLVNWQVWIDKLGYSPTWSADGQADRGWYANGVTMGFANNRGFDFRPAGPWLILSGQSWLTHNAQGVGSWTIFCAATYSLLGHTEFTYTLTMPTIPRNPPPPPDPLGLDQITRNSMRYRFSSTGDGGSPIIRWEFQYADNPQFSSAKQQTSGGTSTVTGLKPGTEYWFRSRGVNAAGTGAWSTVVSARTLSGAWISTGIEWVPAEVLISDGTTWRPGDAQISDGATWSPSV